MQVDWALNKPSWRHLRTASKGVYKYNHIVGAAVVYILEMGRLSVNHSSHVVTYTLQPVRNPISIHSRAGTVDNRKNVSTTRGGLLCLLRPSPFYSTGI